MKHLSVRNLGIFFIIAIAVLSFGRATSVLADDSSAGAPATDAQTQVQEQPSSGTSSFIIFPNPCIIMPMLCTPIPPIGATIHITKRTDVGDGTFTFRVTQGENLVTTQTIRTEEGWGSANIPVSAAGTYTVTEDDSTGWNFGSARCEYDDESVGTSINHGELVSIGSGDTVSCAFTNTAAPKPFTGVVHVAKVVSGGSAVPSDFSFTVNGGEPTRFNENGQKDVTLGAGEYTVTEVPSEGYDASYSAGCTGDLEQSNVVLDDTEATCTITNTWNPPAAHNRTNGSGPVGGGGSGQVLGVSTGPGEVLGASCPLVTTYMHQGGANDPTQVMSLQTFLNGEMKSGLVLNGIFDASTTAAVDAFQVKYAADVLAPWIPFGLSDGKTPTGFVYKTTAWKINSLACPDLHLPMPKLP